MKQNEGKLEEENQILKDVIHDTLWMAIRYAHGRHTTVPSTVRRAVKKIKEIYPDFNLGEDKTIVAPTVPHSGFREDYLDDLFDESTEIE